MDSQLVEDLKLLASSKPGIFDVHYGDFVRSVAQQALWAIEAADEALDFEHQSKLPA